MRERITETLKTALKGGDKERVSTLRMVQAAIKDRDIANRGLGKGPADDGELVAVLTRMVKQREDAAKAFAGGGRPELAQKERAEIEMIRAFLPAQMSEAEVAEAARQAVAEIGASSPKDMGAVIGLLKKRHAGRMDFGRASAALKALLEPPPASGAAG